MLPRSFLWSALKSAWDWKFHLPCDTHSCKIVTCVILYVDIWYMFAAAVTRLISSEANFWRSCTFCAKDVKVLSLYGSHCSRLSSLREREVTSVHCERHGVSLREVPGHFASSAPAGKMRTHLGVGFWCVYVFARAYVLAQGWLHTRHEIRRKKRGDETL